MSKQFYLAVMSCFVFVSALLIFYGNITRTPFHGDESGWISTASYYTQLLMGRSLDKQKWECPECEHFGGVDNLHLGQWLMGIPLECYYALNNMKFFNIFDFNLGGDPHDWSAVYKLNKEAGKMPPLEILLPARGVSAIYGALCCVAVFLIGYYTLNSCVGLIAVLFLMLNQNFIISASRAMTDVHFNFFLLCCYLAIVRFKALTPAASYKKLSLILGIFAGLATSVKISGIVIIGLVFTVSLFYLYFIYSKPWKGILSDLVIFFSTAIAVIYLLNPYFWDLQHPLKFFEMFYRWREVLNGYAVTYGTNFHGYGRSLAITTDLLRYCFNHPILSAPHYFFILIFFLWCLANNILIFAESLFRKTFNPRVIVFLFFIMNYGFILKFMVTSWDRYYLPAVIAAGPMIAIFIYDGLLFFFRMAAKAKVRYIHIGCKAKDL